MNGPGHGPGRWPGFGLGILDAFTHAISGVVMGAAAVLIFTLLVALGIVLVRFLLVATQAAEFYVADHRPAPTPAPAPTTGTTTRPATTTRPPRAPRAPRTPPPTV